MTVRCPGRRRGSLRWVVLAGVLSACGGGGGSETADPTVSTDVTTVPSTVSTAAAVESADPACAAGEQRVVTAFEMDSGAVRWVACSPEAGARWIAGASTDLVYVTVTPRTSNGEADGGGSILVALDTRTGSERWRISLGSGFPRVPSGPFLGDGLVVLVLADGTGTADLLGIDPATGVTVWTTAVPAGGVAVDDDVVVGAGGPITAYDRATGAPRWSIPGSGGYSDPVIGDGVVVVPSDAGLVALDLESGEEAWRTTDTLPGVPGGVEDGILVHGGQDDPTTGVDVRTGEVLWTQPGHSTYDDVFALGDGAAYMFDFGAGDGGATSAVAYEVATGETRWRFSPGPWPFLATDTDVVAIDPNIVVLSTDDGSVRWSTPTGDSLRYVAGAANTDALFVSSEASVTPVAPEDAATPESVVVPSAAAAASVRCPAGQNIGGVGPVGAAGAMAEVLVATDRTAFCLVTPDGTEDVVEIQPQRQVTEPEATTIAGSLAVYVHLTVPVSWAGEATTITDDTGRVLFAVTMPGSADILVIDTAVPLGAPIESRVPHEWVVSADGRELGRVTVDLPAAGSTEQWMAVAVGCLRTNGVNVAAGGSPDAVATDVDRQPIDPTVASAAWSACRPYGLEMLRAMGTPDVDGVVEYLDCMADSGFLALFLGGDHDAAALADARSACPSSAPSPG